MLPDRANNHLFSQRFRPALGHNLLLIHWLEWAYPSAAKRSELPVDHLRLSKHRA